MADPVSLAITVALNAATMAMTMMNKTEGPRLEDLTVSTADYGTPLPQFIGTVRLELPCIYAEPIREEKDKQKGKGGKYVEYKYFGTWASFVADHEIKSCLKLWFDRHLVFDRTKESGPLASWAGGVFGIEGKLKISRQIRIYYGTEDQEPDPRLVAKIEEREGPGRCPAYLGVAYMVFEDIPLEKFGNRLPQVSGVFIRPDPEKLYPYIEVDRNAGLNTEPRYSPDRMKMIFVTGGPTVDYWVMPNNPTLVSSTIVPGAASPVGVVNDGTFYSVGFNGISGGNVFLCSPFGSSTQLVDGRTDPVYTSAFYSGCEYIAGQVCIYPAGLIQQVYGLLASDSLGYYIQGVDPGFVPKHFFESADGNALVVGASATAICVAAVTGFDGAVVVDIGTSPGNTAAMATSDGAYIVYAATPNTLYRIDIETQTVTHTLDMGPSAFDPSVARTAMAGAVPGVKSLYLGFWEVNCDDLSIERTIDPNLWLVEDSDFELYDPTNHAIISDNFIFGDHFDFRFLDREGAASTTLGDLCEIVGLQCGFQAGQYSFTELDQLIPGFSWTQGPGKEVVGPMLEIYDSDIRSHNWIQQGKKRGQRLTGPPISTEWMIPESTEEGGEKPLYEIDMVAETDLPREVYATFADPNMDYQPNTALASRNAASVKTKRTTNFDLGTLHIDPADIQPLLERALRRYWVGATRPRFRLSPLEMRLECGDVREIIFEDGERLRCKCTRTIIRANRIIDTEWQVDGETMFSPVDWELDDANPLDTIFSTPGGYTGGRPPEDVFAPVPSNGELLDVALLRDQDDQTAPFLYTEVGLDFDGFWPGATVWVADELADDVEWAAGFDSFSSGEVTTYGIVIDAMPDALAETIDYGSEVEVYLPTGGTLETITEAEMLADATRNLAVFGQEVVQFCQTTQIEERRWLVSGFIRGARGTEHEMDGHTEGERFVLIESNVHIKTMGAGEIGDTDYYRFATFGMEPDLSPTRTLLFQANPNRPLSPCHIELARDIATGDWSGTFMRRTRVGGATLNGQDVPLGETSEAYRVKILDPDDPDGDPVRTIDVTDTEFDYPAADQVTDFGSVQTTLVVDICQMSPSLSLEGFAARASAVYGPPQLIAVSDMSEGRSVASIDAEWPDEAPLAGDVAILHVYVAKQLQPCNSITATDFTEIVNQGEGGGDANYALFHRCNGTEGDDPVTITVNSPGINSNDMIRARITIWRGVRQSGLPYEDTAAAAGGSANATSGALDTLGNSRAAINLISVSGLVTGTPPSGYVEDYDDQTVTGLDGTMIANHDEIASASTVGASVTTLSGSANWKVVSFALVPQRPA